MQVFEREAAVTEYEFVCTGDSGENRLEIVDFWGDGGIIGTTKNANGTEVEIVERTSLMRKPNSIHLGKAENTHMTIYTIAKGI